MAADIRLDVTARDRASNNLRQIGGNVDRVGGHLKKLAGVAKMGGAAVAGLAAVGIAATAAWVTKGSQSLNRIERIGAQTDAVIKSTGGIAGITRESIDDLAGSIEAMTGTEAESVTEGANMLATFTGIRNETGRNNDVFNQAVMAMTDMNRSMNNTGEVVVDTRKQAVMLGKALNDPIKGVTALQKVGVSFTQSQKDQIAALVEGGDTMKAQKLILGELNKEFGGSAKAFGDSTTGKIERFKHEIGTLQETLAATFAPTLSHVTDYLVDKGRPALQKWGREWNQNAVPAVRNGIRATKELWALYKQDGITGLVQRVETLTGAEGKLTPILDEVTLAGESLWRIVKDLAPAFADAAGEVPPFLSPLRMIGDVLETVADVLESVPDGVKTLGIEVGIAALVFPKLASGAAIAGGAIRTAGVYAGVAGLEMQTAAGRTLLMRDALAKVAPMAKAAAGIGGILLITKGMQDADSATSELKTSLGGAAVGFSVGGPLGAAIGAGVGALLPIYSRKSARAKKATEEAAQAAAEAKQDYDDLRGSLDNLTGATTSSTRATIQDKLERNGVLDKFAAEGVARRTVVDAVLGEGRARREVSRFIAGQESAYSALGVQIKTLGDRQERVSAVGRGKYVEERQNLEAQQQAIRDLIDTYRGLGATTRDGIRDQREQGRVVQDFSALAGKVPPRIVSKLDVKAIYPTITGLARVANRFKGLDNKQIRAIIKVTGVETTVKDVRKVAARLAEVDKQKIELGAFKQSFTRHIGDFREQAGRGGKDIGRRLGDGSKTAKPDLKAFMSNMNGTIGEGKTAASTGSRTIGTNMRTGFSGGFAGADGLWSGQVRGAVRSAINAGKQEADSHSPSRKMIKLGGDLAKGGEIGLRRGSAGLTHAGADLIRDLVKGIGKEKIKAERVLDAIGNEVEKTTNRVKRLQELRASYVADFQGFASSVFTAQAPTLEDGSTGPQTVDGLLSFAAAQADQAKQVQAAVSRLTGPGGLGLSPDLIKQFKAQGAGGIEQILTLAQGSRQQIALLNSLNKDTNGSYAATGLGLFSTQGDKHGKFADQLAQAQRDAKLANTVAHAIREALHGIKLESGEVRIEGSTIIASIHAAQRHKGK